MIECLPEAGCGRPIDLRYTETVGQRGRHAQISSKARTVVRDKKRNRKLKLNCGNIITFMVGQRVQ